MLDELLIANTATYSPDGQNLHDLKQVNFVYGSNGSGKTTLSRALADPGGHPRCSATWRDGDALECLVYNSDFTRENFAEATVPGIFTLGRDNVETREQIARIKEDIDTLETAIRGLKRTREGEDGTGGKRCDLKELRRAFEETCWGYKVAHDEHFADAFEGVRSNKVRFCDRLLAEHGTNRETVYPFDALKKRAARVFDESVETIPVLPMIMFDDLIGSESEPVLAMAVVGREGIDIGGLISRLGNSDWVKRGLAYMPDTHSECPFCQQTVPPDLVSELNAYFDETYMSQIAEIDRIRAVYRTAGAAIAARLDELLEQNSPYLDNDSLRAEADRLSDRQELNARQLDRKLKEASSPVALQSIAPVAEAIQALIDDANRRTREHNQTVENLDAERTRLKAEIWKALLHDGAAAIDLYLEQKRNLDAAVSGIDAGLASKGQALRAKERDLAELESQVTSVEPTVTKINDTLASFGFTNFRLATAPDKAGFYRCVRDNGTDVGRTLSEGEKGFVTFLYFFSRIKGSLSQTGMNEDRLVVLDDPVSSFDSDVLFVVSAMIRSLIDEACRGHDQVKQVLILTHNIYFHKEVSLDHKQTFWIVRKTRGISEITGFERNPIRSSYELLWEEVRTPSLNIVTIQNTLRRILENYFTIFGGVDRDDIVKHFEGDEKLICASLFSWINAGSHSIMDDLSVATDEGTARRYLEVFEKIFVKTDHAAHYRMMTERPE
ncbi:hypothetical protein A9995_10485 [Erythrobacter sp. QSSC1-22B]|uniref:AAA family ATPase n=1 Tax=Erythrobacter sp. QSSC1-22B TaxID=1860125 RepID=UPI0008059CFF|nr:AAA family ATPase [Erythrobacter sp. QSSC1-22B]OBX18953.1 hypothetical protein A9995_10485 [Erythrobacter sp. QSSC1-22B]